MAGRLIAFGYPSFTDRQSCNDFWNPDPWNSLGMIPRRSLGQHFGLGLLDDELYPPQVYRGIYLRPRRQQSNQQATGMSEVVNDKENFQVNLDVSHFKPEDLVIKTNGNRVIIQGRHEERQDEHGYIEREFKRTYILPNDVDPNTVKSTLSGDGVLTLVAPKMTIEPPKERTIPIEMESEPVAEAAANK